MSIYKVGNILKHRTWSFTLKITAVGEKRFLYTRNDWRKGGEFVATKSHLFVLLKELKEDEKKP